MKTNFSTFLKFTIQFCYTSICLKYCCSCAVPCAPIHLQKSAVSPSAFGQFWIFLFVILSSLDISNKAIKYPFTDASNANGSTENQNCMCKYDQRQNPSPRIFYHTVREGYFIRLRLQHHVMSQYIKFLEKKMSSSGIVVE